VSSEQQSNAAATPSPTPSPTPQPHYRTLAELKRSATPTPPPPLIKSLEPFEWVELNRANELLKFFDTAIAVFLTRANVDAKLIGAIKTQFAIKLSETVIRKFQVTSTPVTPENALNTFEELLSKLQQSGVDVTNYMQIIPLLRELVKIAKGGKI